MSLLEVKVSPKASRDALLGWLGGTLKVAVTAAPERGKANAAVESLLAEALSLPRSAVRVIAGGAARNKRVEIAGVDAAGLRGRLEAALADRATR
ncbi:MAG: DUF167 domain-containing protein [Nevskia sp.]|nr:DUF167 domain-containing protein [Nevskia sp.]